MAAHNRFRLIIAACLASLAVSCSRVGDMQFGPKDQRDFAEKFIALFASHNVAAIKKELDPRIDRTKTGPAIRRIVQSFPVEKPAQIQVIHWIKNVTSQGTFYVLEIWYRYSAGNDFLANVVLLPTKTGYRVSGVHFRPVSHSAEAANGLNFAQAPTGRYIFLAAMAIVLGLVVYALISCIVARNLKRKWLWTIFILIGFGKLTLNWTTGALMVQPLTLQLFSVSGLRSGLFAPWVFAISIPLGAIMFLSRRKALQQQLPDDGGPKPSGVV